MTSSKTEVVYDFLIKNLPKVPIGVTDPRVHKVHEEIAQGLEALAKQYSKLHKKGEYMKKLLEKPTDQKNDHPPIRYIHFPNSDRTRLITVAYEREFGTGNVTYGACIWSSMVEYVEPTMHRFSTKTPLPYEKCKKKTFTKQDKKNNRDTALTRLLKTPVNIYVRPNRFRTDLRRAITVFGTKGTAIKNAVPFSSLFRASDFGKCKNIGTIFGDTKSYDLYQYEDTKDFEDLFGPICFEVEKPFDNILDVFRSESFLHSYSDAFSFAKKNKNFGVYHVSSKTNIVVLYNKKSFLSFTPNKIKVFKEEVNQHEETCSDEE